MVERELSLEKNAAFADRYGAMKKELETIEKEYKAGTLNDKVFKLNVMTLRDQRDALELTNAIGDVNSFYGNYLSEWKPPGRN